MSITLVGCPEPSHVAGYTGHIAGMAEVFGKSKGGLTHALFLSPNVSHAEKLVLSDRTADDYQRYRPTDVEIDRIYEKNNVPIPPNTQYSAFGVTGQSIPVTLTKGLGRNMEKEEFEYRKCILQTIADRVGWCPPEEEDDDEKMCCVPMKSCEQLDEVENPTLIYRRAEGLIPGYGGYVPGAICRYNVSDMATPTGSIRRTFLDGIEVTRETKLNIGREKRMAKTAMTKVSEVQTETDNKNTKEKMSLKREK